VVIAITRHLTQEIQLVILEQATTHQAQTKMVMQVTTLQQWVILEMLTQATIPQHRPTQEMLTQVITHQLQAIQEMLTRVILQAHLIIQEAIQQAHLQQQDPEQAVMLPELDARIQHQEVQQVILTKIIIIEI